MGTPGRLWGWALQESLGVTPESVWIEQFRKSSDWALQGVSGVGHSRKSRGVDRARRKVPGEEKS